MELEQSRTSLEETLIHLRHTESEVAAHHASLTGEIAEAKEKLKAQTGRNTELDAAAQALQKELTQRKAALARASRHLDELSQTHREVKSRIEKREADAAEAKDALARAQNTLHRVHHKLRSD